MELLKFSQIPDECFDMEAVQMQNYLLDNGYYGLKNDLTPEPQMEYGLSDLEDIWDFTRNALRKAIAY